jgi:hypothetical protein
MATLIHFFYLPPPSMCVCVCVMKLKGGGGGPIVARTLMEEPEAAKEKEGG